MLADDLGYDDLPCFEQEHYATLNEDELTKSIARTNFGVPTPI